MATRSSIRKAESYWGNVNPVGPRSVYDEAKRFAEAMVMAYHRSRGVNTHLVAHLQHLRPAPASRRRPGDFELHDAGAARRAADHLRRRPADAQLLLCRRSDRGHHAPVAQRGASSRSTSAIPRSSRFWSARKPCWKSRDRRANCALSICRWTIPRAAAPISPRRARCWDGSRAFSSKKG